MGRLTWGVGDGGMETAEVDEGVGAQEEVGDDGGDGVKLGFGDPGRENSLLGNSAKEPPGTSLKGWETPVRPLRLSESQPSP